MLVTKPVRILNLSQMTRETGDTVYVCRLCLPWRLTMGGLWGHGRQGWETLETMGECITIRRIALNDIVGTDLHGEKPPPPLLGQGG